MSATHRGASPDIEFLNAVHEKRAQLLDDRSGIVSAIRYLQAEQQLRA
jgi:hypothetical protein